MPAPEGEDIYNGRAEPGHYIKHVYLSNENSAIALTDRTIRRSQNVLSLVVGDRGASAVNNRRVPLRQWVHSVS